MRAPRLVLFVTCALFHLLESNAHADDFAHGSGVLLYHRFSPSRSNFTTITNQAFEEQIKELLDDGYQFVKLKTLVELVRDSSFIPDKMLAITVDDGHVSQYTYMFPILRKYNVPATLFITTNVISREPNYMTWEQLQEMKASGLIDIQDHTVSHPDFVMSQASRSPEKFSQFIETELMKSKAILEQRLDADVKYIAWPFGAYNSRVMNEAKRLGYEAAFTCNGTALSVGQDLFALPRLPIVPSITARAIKFDLRNRALPVDKSLTKLSAND